MKPCKNCKEFSCGANGSDYVSMKCGSEEGFVRVAADCFSLPNAAELVEQLRAYATTCDNNIYGICMNAPNAMMQAADAIEALMQENAKLKSNFEGCYAANEYLFAKLDAMKRERDAAVADIQKYCRFCIICQNAKFTEDYRHNLCGKCLDEDNTHFEWRGVQKEEE